MRRLRAIGALVCPTLALLPWPALVGGGAAGWLLVWLAHRDPFVPIGEVITMLRLSVVPLATAVASGLEDPTEDDLAGAGIGVAARRWVRLALLVPVAAGLWWGLVAFAATAPGLAQPGGASLPVGAMIIEAAAMLAVALAATAAANSAATATPPAFVAPAVLGVLLVLIQLLPARVALTAAVDNHQAWYAAHIRWAWLGTAALVAFAFACRDPDRRSLRRVLRPAHPRRPADPVRHASDRPTRESQCPETVARR